MDAGARISLSFTGTTVRWIGYRDAWAGRANVYIDGQYTATIDTYSPADQPQAVLFSASGLSSEAHTFALEVTGTRNSSSGGAWVWVDALEVETANVTDPISETPPSGETAPPAISTARFEQNSTFVQYSGSWMSNGYGGHSEGSAVLAMDAGASATFTFSGTGARWIAYTDQWSGIARVYVDGNFRQTVDTYASPDKAQASVYFIDGLTSGSHTLRIEVTGTRRVESGGAWVWIDAFESLSSTTSTTIPADPSLTPVRVEENAAGVTYNGSWYGNGLPQHSGGRAILSIDSSARATFTFTGTKVKWIGYRDPWAGIAKVYIDGVLQTTVDTYHELEAVQATLFESGSLAAGTHTLTIEVTGRKGAQSGGAWVWIDALEFIPVP
jgi:hypothetical protein